MKKPNLLLSFIHGFLPYINLNPLFHCRHPSLLFFFFFLVSSDQSPFPLMALRDQQNPRPLPKFGDWDVNDPASADGYTVIFNKARAEKKTGGPLAKPDTSPPRVAARREDGAYKYPKKSKWFCCG